MKRWSIPLFLSTEAALYLAFLVMDLLGLGGRSVPVKYAALLLCLLIALLSALRGGCRLTAAALSLTAAADWFLLVRGDCFSLGIGLFLVVQTLYLLRLRRMGTSPTLWLRAGLALLLSLAAYSLGLGTPLNLLACLYFSQLLSNTLLAWTVRARQVRLLALGLTLFVGCDLCVGLFNLLPASSPLYSAASVGMWLFYLPSQVLIVLSALPKQEASHETQ